MSWKSLLWQAYLAGWMLYFVVGTAYDVIRYDVAGSSAAIGRYCAVNGMSGVVWPLAVTGRLSEAYSEPSTSKQAGVMQPAALLDSSPIYLADMEVDRRRGEAVPDHHTFTIKDLVFSVECPAGLTLLDDPDAVESVFVLPANRLHLTFATELDAACITIGVAPTFERFVTVQSNRELDRFAVDSDMFRGVVASVRSQEFTKAIPRNIETANRALDKRQHIDDAEIVGFNETRDGFMLTAIVKPRNKSTRVNTVVMRHVRECCIFTAATSLLAGQEDVEWTRSVAMQCAESVR